MIVKGQLELLENATPLHETKPEEWNRQDRIALAAIQIHLSESLYYTMQLCTTANRLWQMFLNTYEKKETATKIYLVEHLYNL